MCLAICANQRIIQENLNLQMKLRSKEFVFYSVITQALGSALPNFTQAADRERGFASVHHLHWLYKWKQHPEVMNVRGGEVNTGGLV